jgi:hypothetical protein
MFLTSPMAGREKKVLRLANYLPFPADLRDSNASVQAFFVPRIIGRVDRPPVMQREFVEVETIRSY